MGTAKVKHGDSDVVSGAVFQKDKIQPRHITTETLEIQRLDMMSVKLPEKIS